MKWKNSIWLLISFLIGVLVCYLTLQFSFFQVKLELDVPNIIISIITLLVGLYIAINLQKKINKGQKQYAFIINKLDVIWIAFNDFSGKLSVDTKLDVSSIRKLIKEVIQPASFLKSIIKSFEIDNKAITILEEKLDVLETKLSNYPATNNIVEFGQEQIIIDTMIFEINKCFSEILKEIQNL